MARQKISYDPKVLDLVLYAGDGVGLRLIVTDSDQEPMDLSGTSRAYIRLSRDDYTDPPNAEFTVDDSDATDGILVLTLTGDETAALVVDLEDSFVGVWDVEWTPTDGEPLTLVQGKVECLPDVTH